VELTVVDAFTEMPFSGNPAAIAVVESFPSVALMQSLALEMNLSETAFVAKRADGDYDLRWFTPVVEVDLCGHATLAAAHVLGESSVRFHTRSGVLTCIDAGGGLIEMEFPSDPPERSEPPTGLDVPGLRWYGHGKFDALLVLGDAVLLRTMRPDLAQLEGLGTRGVIFTAEGDRPGIDCVSRFFAPNVGVTEDPVTGSAHCTLAAYWSCFFHREVLVGEQASARGGLVRMRLKGDGVVLGGHAVTVSSVRFQV
jgi:predicted PhzF superfamily epimerase YddE/YHI9